MSLFSFRKPKVVSTLQEQGSGLVGDIRETARQLASHARSLLALFGLELAEYVSRQARKAVLLALAAVMLLVSYALLCVFCCVVLNYFTDSWLWAVGIVLLVNMLLGLVVLSVALRMKSASFAAATRQEIKNDLECLKILLSKEKTSS